MDHRAFGRSDPSGARGGPANSDTRSRSPACAHLQRAPPRSVAGRSVRAEAHRLRCRPASSFRGRRRTQTLGRAKCGSSALRLGRPR
eukprot:5052634-Prymnesium_polylepis.1